MRPSSTSTTAGTGHKTFEETFSDAAALATATNIDEPVSATDVNGTVAVEDGNGGSDTITVILEVTDQNEPPLAPTPVFVSPTSGSASKLNVSWHPPTNTGRPSINNYDLQYREVGAANYTNGPQNVSGSRINISGLKSGTVYQVQVRATNAEGDGPWTPAVEGSTSQNSEPDPPAVTYGLRATGVSQTRIDLSWNAPTDDGGASITGYRIEVSDDGGSTWSDLVANTGNSSRTYAHTDLAAGVTRHYRVSAINRVGTGLRFCSCLRTDAGG